MLEALPFLPALVLDQALVEPVPEVGVEAVVEPESVVALAAEGVIGNNEAVAAGIAVVVEPVDNNLVVPAAAVVVVVVDAVAAVEVVAVPNMLVVAVELQQAVVAADRTNFAVVGSEWDALTDLASYPLGP